MNSFSRCRYSNEWDIETFITFFFSKLDFWASGATSPYLEFDWPEKIKGGGKAVFFMKRERHTVVPKDEFKLYLRYGELSNALLANLSSTTENVSSMISKYKKAKLNFFKYNRNLNLNINYLNLN